MHSAGLIGRATIVALLAAGAAAAPAADFTLVPETSRLEFEAEQQGAEFRGRFGDFAATLHLDDDPAANRLEATVRLASVDTDYEERDGYLRGEEWFDAAQWPEARLVTAALRPVGEGRYEADAELTIRDVTRPVSLPLTFDGRRLTGRLTIDRRDFGIGQGMWEDDRMVGADVTILIDVALEASGGEG